MAETWRVQISWSTHVYFNLGRLRVNTVMLLLLLMPVFTLYTPDLVTSDIYHRERCLLSHTFYHPQSGECHPGLERGPCDIGQWLVPDPGHPGVATCHQTPADVVTKCHTPVHLDSGQLTCLESTDVMEAFTQAHCTTGEILMPANFELNKKPCPDNFHCSSNYQKYIQEKKGSLLYGPAVEYLRNLKCDNDPRSVCLPDNGKSPFLLENIYDSFKNPKLICKKNPCPSSLPALDEKGYYICQNNLVALWMGSLHNKCRKGQIFRRGRCVSRFFG